jgi:flagellar basal-body rod protein FlgB
MAGNSILFDPTLSGLAEALTLHQRRHEVIASNLANVETPGYRAQELDFAATLKEAFKAAGPAGPERPGGVRPPDVVPDASAPPRADGNTVDVDLQMAKLSQNGGRYVALAKILQQRIQQLKFAIDGTR